MKNIEKRFYGLIFGSIFPISLGLMSETIWFFLDKNERRPILYLTIGILLGILIDLKFLKKWNNRRYTLPIWTIISAYLLYNIFVYGFFMGFPVFNTFLGLLAGFYYGKRICFNKTDTKEYSKIINKVSFFTGLIMTFVCISSGIFALYNYEAAGMIKDIFGLDFEISHSMVWAIVIIGGLLLIFINVFLTRISMIRIINRTIYYVN